MIDNINQLLSDIQDIIVDVLRSIDLDNSNFAKNIDIIFEDNDVVIRMPDYGIYIDRGRNPGEAPPVSAIVDFVRQKGITSTDLTEEQLAYAIAQSIAEDGIEPRPFIERLQEQLTNLISQHIYLEMNKMIKNTLT